MGDIVRSSPDFFVSARQEGIRNPGVDKRAWRQASLADEKVKEATWFMYRLSASGPEVVDVM